jgi:hypothetical protein
MQPPTDTFPKFLAIGGLVLCLFLFNFYNQPASAYITTSYRIQEQLIEKRAEQKTIAWRINDLKSYIKQHPENVEKTKELDQLQYDLELISNHLFEASNFINNMDQSAKNRIKQNPINFYGSFGVGILVTVIGAVLWYRDEKQKMKITELQMEKLQLENKKLGIESEIEKKDQKDLSNPILSKENSVTQHEKNPNPKVAKRELQNLRNNKA